MMAQTLFNSEMVIVPIATTPLKWDDGDSGDSAVIVVEVTPTALKSEDGDSRRVNPTSLSREINIHREKKKKKRVPRDTSLLSPCPQCKPVGVGSVTITRLSPHSPSPQCKPFSVHGGRQ